MIKNSEVEEIKELIKNGFDLELISFELGIPIERVTQYKLELETINKSDYIKTHSTRKIIDGKNENAHTKIQQMREKYKKLFLKNNNIEVKQPKELSDEEIKYINSVITEIEGIIKGIEKITKKERINEVNAILTKIKEIENYQLTIGQSEKLNSLIQSKELEELCLNKTDKIDFYINKARRIIIKKLAEAIDIAQAQTENLQELEILDRKLTTKMQQSNPINVSSVKSRIINKKFKINQQKASNRIRNDVSTDIKLISKEIANGTLDIKMANEIINKEAKKRIESKPQNKFSLTEEQEKKQILIQIKTILMEKPEEYYIKNPQITIMQMQKLFGGELEQAIRTVVSNLIGIKDFERAKEVCDIFRPEDKDSQLSKYITTLKEEIRNAEIGDIVLKGLNMNGTEEEDKKYFELIEKGLEMGNIKKGRVFLGKSQDGSRNIYLSDIWENQEKTR